MYKVHIKFYKVKRKIAKSVMIKISEKYILTDPGIPFILSLSPSPPLTGAEVAKRLTDTVRALPNMLMVFVDVIVK